MEGLRSLHISIARARWSGNFRKKALSLRCAWRSAYVSQLGAQDHHYALARGGWARQVDWSAAYRLLSCRLLVAARVFIRPHF